MDQSKHKTLCARTCQWRAKFWSNSRTGRDLRRKYGKDWKAYMTRMPLDDDDRIYLQERGMETFIRMEKRLLRDMRMRSLRLTGRSACEDFVAAIASERPSLAMRSNFIFVALDFEGSFEKWGIKEAGFTRFDTRDVIQARTSKEPENMLHTIKYELGRHNHKYLHGSAIRTHSGQLPSIIQQQLTIPESDTDSTPRKIVLVGHSIQNEFREMDAMGVFIEDLPWIEGIIDTAYFSSEITGLRLSLGNLARTLGLSPPDQALHCAGNDSIYTTRVLLALIYHQQCGGVVSRSVGMRLRQLKDIALTPIEEVEKERDPPAEDIIEIFGDGGFGIFA